MVDGPEEYRAGARMRTVENLPVVTYLSMDSVTSTVGASQVLAYVERLAERGLRLDLVTFEESSDDGVARRLADGGVAWRPQPFGRRGPVGGLGRVVRASRLLRGAQLVHARSDMAAAATMLAGVDRWLWDVRSLWVDQKVATGVVRAGSLEERIFRWVERRSAWRASALVTLTASVIDELERRHGVQLADRTRVVTTCVDLDRFAMSPMPGSGPIRVLLSGTLNRYYDVDAMLAVVAELQRRRPVELVVASPGITEWEDDFIGMEVSRVSAVPEEMPELVASCHVGLCICRDDAGVSLSAAMPTKIGEFLAVGRPVVVNPGLVDAAGLVESWRAGVVQGSARPGSLVDAVDQIEALVADSGTPGRCRALAADHFDLDAGVSALLDAYADVAEAGEGTP